MLLVGGGTLAVIPIVAGRRRCCRLEDSDTTFLSRTERSNGSGCRPMFAPGVGRCRERAARVSLARGLLRLRSASPVSQGSGESGVQAT